MKKVLMTILTAGLAFAMINTSGTAYAEDFIESKKIPQKKNTDATVIFSAPKNGVKPVNPKDPLSPNDYELGEDGEETSYKGPLSLDVVPHFNFGEGIINSKETTLFAKNQQPYIQVTDLRGPEGGWHVSAQLSEFNIDIESDKKTLKGASITLINGEVISTVEKPSKKPSISNEITLESGKEASNIVSANAKTEEKQAQGLGTWLVGWLTDQDENKDVKLTVPAFEASVGSHKATINWTLSEGPSTNTSAGTTEAATSNY